MGRLCMIIQESIVLTGRLVTATTLPGEYSSFLDCTLPDDHTQSTCDMNPSLVETIHEKHFLSDCMRITNPPLSGNQNL